MESVSAHRNHMVILNCRWSGISIRSWEAPAAQLLHCLLNNGSKREECPKGKQGCYLDIIKLSFRAFDKCVSSYVSDKASECHKDRVALYNLTEAGFYHPLICCEMNLECSMKYENVVVSNESNLLDISKDGHYPRAFLAFITKSTPTFNPRILATHRATLTKCASSFIHLATQPSISCIEI